VGSNITYINYNTLSNLPSLSYLPLNGGTLTGTLTGTTGIYNLLTTTNTTTLAAPAVGING
jgi:hypothetical protein